MILHEIVYAPGDRIIIVNGWDIPNGTRGALKEIGEECVMVRDDCRGWTHRDGTRNCWNVFRTEFALDVEYEEFGEDCGS